ncbi:MAG TPA: divergent polysaccharide deacetylase family protein, partial [Thermoanaerobaculia bacterium]
LTSMSDSEIVSATRENIAAVPHARGVNNHMGSRATADRRVMTDVLGALPHGMYFIDSRTGGGSVAATIAREMNVKTAARQVFLDDIQTDAAVRRQLRVLSAAARAKGVAIGIGHPHEVTLRVLAREVPGLRAEGFRIVRASQVVN